MVVGQGSHPLVRRLGLATAGTALACMGFLAVASSGDIAVSLSDDRQAQVPLNPNGSGEPTPGASVAPSTVDCSDPNNTINCPGPNLDSPLVPGTAAPGSPYRD